MQTLFQFCSDDQQGKGENEDTALMKQAGRRELSRLRGWPKLAARSQSKQEGTYVPILPRLTLETARARVAE